MRIEDVLNEGISDVVYHATNPAHVLTILNNNSFKLTPAFTKDAEDMGDRSKYYFLSTARTRLARFHQGDSQALIKLDGRKLANNYSGEPLDYFDDNMRRASRGAYEEEDRIYSDDNEIPNAVSYISRIDLVMSRHKEENVLKVYSQCKKLGIPVRVFENGRDRDAQQNVMTHEEIMAYVDNKEQVKGFRSSPSPIRNSNSVLQAFYALKFDNVYEMDSLQQKMVGHFIKKWTGVDKNIVKQDFQNATNASRQQFENLLRQLSQMMKREGIRNIEELGDHIVDKWNEDIGPRWGGNL